MVFPMCMGVFLKKARRSELYVGLPHVYGGVPMLFIAEPFTDKSSPCVWGCSLLKYSCESRMIVFPMCMGVFLLPESERMVRMSLPHVYGGVLDILGMF